MTSEIDPSLVNLVKQFTNERGIDSFIQFLKEEEFDYDLVEDDVNQDKPCIKETIPMHLFMKIKSFVNRNQKNKETKQIIHVQSQSLQIPNALIDANLSHLLQSISNDSGFDKFKTCIAKWEFDYSNIKDDINDVHSDLKDAIPINLFLKIKSLVNANENKKSMQIFKSLPAIQSVRPRLIACNGDCGSKLSQIIDCCIDQKDIKQIKGKTRAIEDAFYFDGSPIRSLIVNLLQENNLCKGGFYLEIYNELNDECCCIEGKEWVNRLVRLFEMLSVKYLHILTQIANAKCEIPQRSLFEEITAYNRRCTKSKRMNKNEFHSKITAVIQSKKYQIMLSKNIKLERSEILSIILYCDYDIFVNKMRESHRKEQVNSCKWRQLFTHLCRGVKKIYKALHYKNIDFCRKRVFQNSRNELFRGSHGVSFDDENRSQLSIQTITSFTEKFTVAQNFVGGRGLILMIPNAFDMIYKGNLKAADVSWISKYPYEKEWIVLPVKFNSICKVQPYNPRYVEFTERISTKPIFLYEANILTHECDIKTCPPIKQLIIELLEYQNKNKAITVCAENANIVDEYTHDNGNILEFMDNCQHVLGHHYQAIMFDDDDLYQHTTVKQNDQHLFLMKQLRKFLQYFDGLSGERKDGKYISSNSSHHLPQLTCTMNGAYVIIGDSLNEFSKYVLATYYLVQHIQSTNNVPLEISCWIIPDPQQIGYIDKLEEDDDNDVEVSPETKTELFITHDVSEAGKHSLNTDVKYDVPFTDKNKVEITLPHSKDILTYDCNKYTKFSYIKEELNRMYCQLAEKTTGLASVTVKIDRRYPWDQITLVANESTEYMKEYIRLHNLYTFCVSYKILNSCEYQSNCYINQSFKEFKLKQIHEWSRLFHKIDDNPQELSDENLALLQPLVINEDVAEPFVEFYSHDFDDMRYILTKEYTNIGPVFEYGKHWPDDITQKYANLKEEVLKNIYAKVTANQWNTVLRKSQTIKNGTKDEGENENIQHLKMVHIVALKLFTDFDLLQREFKKTFRTNEPERMREFYHWRKELQDTFDIINRMCSKSDQPNILFRGINSIKCIDQYQGIYYGPISTTSDLHTARSFAGKNGMILVMRPKTDKIVYDISWISDHTHEREYLLFDHEIDIETWILSSDYDLNRDMWRIMFNREIITKEYKKRMEAPIYLTKLQTLMVDEVEETSTHDRRKIRRIMDFDVDTITDGEKIELLLWMFCLIVIHKYEKRIPSKYEVTLNANLQNIMKLVHTMKIPQELVYNFVEQAKKLGTEMNDNEIKSVFNSYFMNTNCTI